LIEVRFQRGLHLPELDLWLDPWDAKPRAFVSHAHADPFAYFEWVFGKLGRGDIDNGADIRLRGTGSGVDDVDAPVFGEILHLPLGESDPGSAFFVVEIGLSHIEVIDLLDQRDFGKLTRSDRQFVFPGLDRGFFPDISFGREPSNSTGGTFTRVASGFPGAHPNSEVEITAPFIDYPLGIRVPISSIYPQR